MNKQIQYQKIKFKGSHTVLGNRVVIHNHKKSSTIVKLFLLRFPKFPNFVCCVNHNPIMRKCYGNVPH